MFLRNKTKKHYFDEGIQDKSGEHLLIPLTVLSDIILFLIFGLYIDRVDFIGFSSIWYSYHIYAYFAFSSTFNYLHYILCSPEKQKVDLIVFLRLLIITLNPFILFNNLIDTANRFLHYIQGETKYDI